MKTVTVYPGGRLAGEVSIPSSKPHMQRALLLALLNSGKTRINNVSWCTETEKLLTALTQFGMKVLARESNALLLQGVGRDVEVGEPIEAEGSGMLFRISTALASLANGVVRIRCNDSLFSRDSVFDEAFFSHLGVQVRRRERNLVEIARKSYPARLPMTTHKSTQFASFALFVAPFGEPSILVEPEAGQAGYIDMTIQSMALLGSTVIREPGRMIASAYRAGDIAIDIPSDFTSLSYIASSVLSIGKPGGVTIRDYYPGRTLNEQTLFGLYRQFGLALRCDEQGHTLKVSREEGVSEASAEISLSELPSVAANLIAATSNLGERIRFSGVSGINNHKCQRALVISENIRAMGGRSSLLFNGIGMFDRIEIEGRGPLAGGAALPSYKDHRICAANIIAALGAKQKTLVHDVDKLDDGFPRFIETLRALGAELA
ncbi:3-phosphoshikimate 1-carboxyvinyltransferase [Burkholderia catarinensis]|uniref:3-phosphoshikimate 1-carboxyvinyltransferase n=1 Tax=Burkholderia catarinensis TaxID=1108140 RepID=UPI000919E8BF|nr:3-phosphoshikimate 1-carboxyvinyltransferase [Burkholderia catarinensis]KAG8154029.1 3-phosphoshikimate 1-carboxyvinyltransferase [Burkholderia catarinensis]